MCKAAQIRAKEITTLFEHERPDGTSCFTAFDDVGFDWVAACGENIAMGSTTPEGTMNQWMNSSGHKANILDKRFTQLGVGVEGIYWVQMFSGG